jgi:DNA-binding NtrC family response regulator
MAGTPSIGPMGARSALAALALLNARGEVRPMEEVEAEIIRFAIAHYRGQMSEVARRLGIGRSTLYRKLEQFKIGDTEDPENSSEHVAAG